MLKNFKNYWQSSELALLMGSQYEAPDAFDAFVIALSQMPL